MGGASPNISGGAGGVQPDFSSSAASGDATTGSNSVYVGGFNPPALPMDKSMQLLAIAAVLTVALLWYKKKR